MASKSWLIFFQEEGVQVCYSKLANQKHIYYPNCSWQVIFTIMDVSVYSVCRDVSFVATEFDFLFIGVIVTRKTVLQERPVLSLNKQVNIAESDHVSFQSSQDGALNEESKDSVSLDTRPIQLSPEVSKQVAVSEPEKQSSSPVVATTDIPTNTSPKKGLVNSNITEERHKILPGLPKEPQLASVLGFRSLPGIPGLNKAQESDKGSLPK